MYDPGAYPHRRKGKGKADAAAALIPSPLKDDGWSFYLQIATVESSSDHCTVRSNHLFYSSSWSAWNWTRDKLGFFIYLKPKISFICAK